MADPKTRPDWESLYALAREQLSHFTTAQAVALGFSRELLIHHTNVRRLVRVRRGIYRVRHFPVRERESLMVLWLWSKHQGVFSHRTALHLLGLSATAPLQVEMTLPLSWKRRRLKLPPDLALYYSDIPDAERVRVGPLPVTGSARTLRDAGPPPRGPVLASEPDQEADHYVVKGPTEPLGGPVISGAVALLEEVRKIESAEQALRRQRESMTRLFGEWARNALPPLYANWTPKAGDPVVLLTLSSYPPTAQRMVVRELSGATCTVATSLRSQTVYRFPMDGGYEALEFPQCVLPEAAYRALAEAIHRSTDRLALPEAQKLHFG